MFTPLVLADYHNTLASTTQGIVLWSKKLCPHCANMAKVLEKFLEKHPGVSLFTADCEEDPEAAAALGASRAPTLIIIKKGKEVARKTGVLNPRELAALYAVSTGDQT